MRDPRVTVKHRLTPVLPAWILLLLPILSCSGEQTFYQYRQIERGEWHRDSLLLFSTDSLFQPEGPSLGISLEITSNNQYPYRDLWMLVEQNISDTLFQADTLQLLLADEKGKFLGSSAGGLHQLTVPYIRVMVDEPIRPYQVRIRHLMADDPLQGIEKVGVKVVAAAEHQ